MSEDSQKLVDDFTSKSFPKRKGKYFPDDGSSLVYNLFRGNYKFSAKQYKEIFNHITSTNNSTIHV